MCDFISVLFSSVGTCRMQFCVLDSCCPPAVPKIIGLFVWRRFVCGADYFRNISVSLVSDIPLSALSTICWFGDRTIFLGVL